MWWVLTLFGIISLFSKVFIPNYTPIRAFLFSTISLILDLFIFQIFKNIYLATSGLSCSTWDLLLRHAGSVVMLYGLSCPVACEILVPQPGVELTFPALQGRFLTTGPREKSRTHFFKSKWFSTTCAQLLLTYLTLCGSLNCSPPGTSIHGILQERILE